MEIRQLEHFVAVAEERSFTRAARRLAYVQSALSVSIQSLERELGVRLFDRTTHRVALTDAGRALLPSARQAIFSFEQTREFAAALTGVLRGRLRLGMMQAFAFLDVPELLGQFHRDHPEVEIELHPSSGGSAALIDELRQGASDIAFVSVSREPPGITTSELGVEDFVLVGAPELLPRSRRRIELAELADFPFVDFPSGWGVRAVNDQAFAAAALARRLTIEVADVETLLRLLRAELGLALLPRSLVPEHGYGLQTRRLAHPHTWRVVMAFPSSRPASATATAFMRLITGRVHGGTAQRRSPAGRS